MASNFADEVVHQEEPSATLSPQEPLNHKFVRSYYACERCRKRKVKCIVTGSPPCSKCARERRECVFAQHRKTPKHREPPGWNRIAPMTPESASQNLDLNQRPQLGVPVPPSLDNNSTPDLTNPIPPDNNIANSVSRPSLIERAMPSTMLDVGEETNFRRDAGLDRSVPLHSHTNLSPEVTLSNFINGSANSDGSPSVPVIVKELSQASNDVLSVWNKCRFVRQGWFTAQAAVTYVDLFHQHIAPFSPVLFTQYCEHKNHQKLVQQEPMLCCTILMIASRFFFLAGTGSLVRGQMIHQRLWDHCEILIRRILYGQEKIWTSRMRVVSTIESFLLISDWHPQPILFPLDSDGLDEDPDTIDPQGRREVEREHGPSVQWRDQVLDPSRRSDRMSLMMLGTATNLAYELGLFADDLGITNGDDEERSRRMRTRKLLYIYVTNVAVRMGCPSGLPQDIVFAASKESYNAMTETSGLYVEWNTICDSWLELVRLHKAASAIFFGSSSFTRKKLLNGQYVTIIHHITPLLEKWYRTFQTFQDPQYQAVRDLLYIEYQTLRSFVHALSIQAVVERAVARGIQLNSRSNILNTCFLSQDTDFIHEVITSTQEILRTATAMGSTGTLRLVPVRQSISIVSSSILLLKAISLGVSNADLRSSLDTLDRCILVLKSSLIVNELEFTARFATLVEERVARFKTTFVSPPEGETALMQMAANRGNPLEGVPGVITTPYSHEAASLLHSTDFPDTLLQSHDVSFEDMGDWYMRPFDPSYAPFSTWGDHISSTLEIDSLDFLWNVSME